jgi:hypothetical protein
MNVTFPALRIAARRLGLDAGDLAESVLHAVDCDQDEQEATRMSIIEALRRRGAYHGLVKAAVESGEIFQMREDGSHDGFGTGRMGRGDAATNSAPPAAERIGFVVNAE